MPHRRTIVSVIRTVVYAGLTVFLAFRQAEIRGLADAVLVGGVLGDYLTWLVWSVIELPESWLHGGYEAVVNTLFGLVVFRMGNVDLRADVNGEFLGAMFLAFLLVTACKVGYLMVVYVEEETEDDE